MWDGRSTWGDVTTATAGPDGATVPVIRLVPSLGVEPEPRPARGVVAPTTPVDGTVILLLRLLRGVLTSLSGGVRGVGGRLSGVARGVGGRLSGVTRGVGGRLSGVMRGVGGLESIVLRGVASCLSERV